MSGKECPEVFIDIRELHSPFLLLFLWSDFIIIVYQYNIRLKPNDLVYIPDSSDTTVYVMGAVAKPGAYRLTPGMTYLDALAQAGGPNEDADTNEISLYRPGRDAVQKLDFKSLLTEGRKVNYALEEGDIVYLPKRGLAEVGYVLRQLMPGLSFMTFGYTAGAFGSTTSGK